LINGVLTGLTPHQAKSVSVATVGGNNLLAFGFNWSKGGSDG